MNLKDVIEENTYYSFYGVNQNHFKLGQVVFEALEDESDGYRSYLDSIPVVKADKIFSRKPIANVRVKFEDDFTILIDDYEREWLTIGTDHSCDYYPYFVFKYNPNSNQLNYAEELDPLVIHAEKFI